jgi:hypothetical protein
MPFSIIVKLLLLPYHLFFAGDMINETAASLCDYYHNYTQQKTLAPLAYAYSSRLNKGQDTIEICLWRQCFS